MARASADAALPGNPYAPEATQSYGLSEPQALRYAILAVAHELRTANLQRQAAVVADQPDFTDAAENDYALWGALQQQVAKRMGYVAP